VGGKSIECGGKETEKKKCMCFLSLKRIVIPSVPKGKGGNVNGVDQLTFKEKGAERRMLTQKPRGGTPKPFAPSSTRELQGKNPTKKLKELVPSQGDN